MRELLRIFYPDVNELGWKPVRFQPFLMTALFVSGCVLLWADLGLGVPSRFVQDRTLGLLQQAWLAMLLGAPLLGLGASGVMRARLGCPGWVLGLIMRLCADIWSAVALWSYIVARLLTETYVVSGAILLAVGVFSVALLERDFQAVREERGRRRIRKANPS